MTGRPFYQLLSVSPTLPRCVCYFINTAWLSSRGAALTSLSFLNSLTIGVLSPRIQMRSSASRSNGPTLSFESA